MKKIKALFLHSVTILWARVVTIAGVVLAVGANLAADPSINGAVQQILQPKFIPFYVIGIGVITEIARRRTAKRRPDAF